MQKLLSVYHHSSFSKQPASFFPFTISPEGCKARTTTIGCLPLEILALSSVKRMVLTDYYQCFSVPQSECPGRRHTLSLRFVIPPGTIVIEFSQNKPRALHVDKLTSSGLLLLFSTQDPVVSSQLRSLSEGTG